MDTALSWIKAYVPDLDVTPSEYTDAMTLTGTKVEGYKELDKNLEKIVVGEILSIEKHPDANKLIICQVDVGNEKIQIVTGASNVSVGDKVPVVLDGGKVAGGHDGGPLPENGIKIKKGKLRGVESFGMMCSIDELGQDKNYFPDAPENGIYILPKDSKVGSDAIELLGLRDTIFEYEITSNRVDCYGVIGIAREAAATFKKKFVLPKVNQTGNSENVADYLSVEVRDSELCKRYVARVVKNIKLAPSPAWMQERLRAVGIRPINNIVDITNYVMAEYGQPMHAFDYDLLEGHKIVVDRAKDGKEFETLDGMVRKLDKDILMINDGKKAVAVAGIMGGENSKITDDVTTMVFECATFDGTNIRLSSKRLGLRTDSSGKFEKGLDPNNAYDAMMRACSLVEELGAGEVVGGCVDVYPVKAVESRVKFEPERINKLLGTDISREDMLEIFDRIELKYDKETDEIVAPTFRQDIHFMADLAEEVARFFGYDKIPTTLPKSSAAIGGINLKLEIEELARDVAKFLGFSEAMNYSFESTKVFDKLNLSKDSRYRKAIEISNPLGEDFKIMRTQAVNGILNSLSTNYNRRNKDVHLFELANIYIPKELPLKELPDERMQFVLGFYGKENFFDMKGVVEEFLYTIGIVGKLHYDPSCKEEFLHPGRKADIVFDGVRLGYLGEVHPLVCENYKLGERTYIAVLDLPNIIPFVNFDIKYTGIAKYPPISRDISLVVPKNILVGEIEDIIEKNGGSNLESFKLFDIYEGDQIEAGFKSVAYSLTFRNKERTLLDTEVNEVMDKILNKLEAKNIKIRS
ncbi:phenylalanine--tRNA ligase, beta subunit [Lachnoanaerobaculum saburreum F0468]|jgi:phenylalanine--tRNA ligase, beta subunit|uniref:Phenylalanine--tRNA ligase beta subunit n=1 Tax=Lachnoanaerobaculum saburreum F0468 TaxID=1095750 RepID=I0R5G1_9FIRM|nr:phenylalanine--tRNA ligase subunit beta [Lachnoanaerobaculum saburreum]EIC94919.1 phenylalanine--tRNA ligase, beta subunit [Lachnoanaerobaculum saburreum F0468]